MDLWREFLKINNISCHDFCELVRTMFSVPAKIRWIERSYSTLEHLCQKRRNRMDAEMMKSLFFLAVLKLDVKEALDYEPEINFLTKSL